MFSERKESIMKKIAGIILALSLALFLVCAAAQADEIPQPEGGKKFETNWAIFDMTVNIYYEEEGYRVYIKSTDPFEHIGEEWEYSCFYNEEKDALVSISSSKNSWTTDPETGEVRRGEYEYEGFDEENQETVFAIDEDGRLTWEDGRGDAGADLVFTDIGAFEGFWCSEDGKTWAEIAWNDSEIGDEYGYNVFFHEGSGEAEKEASLHGLYNPKTGKLVVVEGGYSIDDLPPDSTDPAAVVFSSLGGGKILLEQGNGIELIYDPLGGDSQG